MFKDLKLKTVTLLLTLILGGMACLLVYGMWSIQGQLLRIDDLWHQYQVDRAEKPRLQSNLRKAIGYGGMIHNFKNYVLRQDASLLNLLHENFGAARAVLAQYTETSTSAAENAAIQDILSVITQYEHAAKKITPLIRENLSVEEIDALVKIDDRHGLHGLQLLRDEVEIQETERLLQADLKRTRLESKGSLVSNLRASLGYGGMIHDFKNYVLRRDQSYLDRIESSFEKVWQAIQEYKTHKLKTSEKHALEYISSTMRSYQENIERIREMNSLKKTAVQIDKAVIVDDSYALRGLSILEKEVALQSEISAREVNTTLHTATDILNYVGGFILVLVIVLIFLSLWLMLSQVIGPVRHMTTIMTDLASNRLDVEIAAMGRTNEMGAMARAIGIFKSTALQRQEAEEQLKETNLKLNSQIQEVEKLRENAQEQAAKAIALAENLADARVVAENARMEAESGHRETQMILDTIQDAIISTDQNAIIISFNPAAEMIFGYSAREVIGHSVSILMPEEMRAKHQQFFEKFQQGSHMREPNMTVEQLGQHKDGHQFPIEILLNSAHVNGQYNFTTAIRDITERKAAEEEIKRLAMSDALTGLANRNRFQQRLTEAIQMAERRQDKFVLFMMDLDKFKPVNDQYGHLVGDAVLVNIASQLKEHFRVIDTVARFGGDEFAVIVTALDDKDDAEIYIERVLASMAKPIMVDDHQLDIGISIGVSIYPDDATEANALINSADKALYLAKKQKGNCARYYSSVLMLSENQSGEEKLV